MHHLEESDQRSPLKEIARLENTLNISLPSSYKEFILSGAGSSIIRKCFTRKFEDMPQVLAVDFFSSVEGILSYHLDNVDGEVAEAELLLIGHATGNKIICVGIGESNNSQIFVFDWDFGPTFQAVDLSEFVSSLYDCE